MLLIVAHHSIWHSCVMNLMGENPLCSKSIFFYIFGMCGKTGIDCFMLITGYFMCKSAITIKKYLKLLLEVIFYNVVIYTIFVVAGKHQFSSVELFFAIVPIQEIGGSFISCFLLYYLFIPYLTILVSQLNKKQHRRLLVLCLFIYTVLITLPYFQVTMNHITWYSVLFFIGSYIRKYDLFPALNTIQWGGFLCYVACFL